MVQIFPSWMDELGYPGVELEGIDFRLHDDPRAYRKVVERIRADNDIVGALITTHKIDLLAAARDLFDDLDPYAQQCGEVSAIAKHDGRCQGFATDPVAARLTLDYMLQPGHFARRGKGRSNVLCFGAGGAATAIALCLIDRPQSADRPAHFVVVDRLQSRLDKLAHMVGELSTDITFEFIHNDAATANDTLLAESGAGSLVINATGMGKDIPGSPITDLARFPQESLAWELNYRGALDFLQQARAQPDHLAIRAQDGWRYFLHGWTGVISKVFARTIKPETFDRLEALALVGRSKS